LAHIGVIAGNLIWRRLLDRWGAGLALRRSVPLAASYAILVALFPNLTLILLFGVLINLINPGVSLSHTNTLYQICPRERRASFMAIYATVANAGAFLAPMIGVALSNVIDIRWILLAGGLIRLTGAVLFQFNRIDPPEAAGT
jgi:MFS family permease